MEAKRLFRAMCFLTLFGVLITSLFVTSCHFCPGTPLNEFEVLLCSVQPANITSSDHSLVFEDEGKNTVIIYHGHACADSSESGTQHVLKVVESLPLPSYVTNATVFLNGWHLQFKSGDHNIAGLGTVIRNISLKRNTLISYSLNWEAAGVLSDDNFDDPYNWCYYYTVIGWNSSNINLTVNQDDVTCDPHDQRGTNFFVSGNGGATALSSFPRYIYSADFASNKTVAILPRGLGYSWYQCPATDHNLLQVAYNMDHSEILIESGKKYYSGGRYISPILPNSPSQVGIGYVTWETSAIFKDNDTVRNYNFGELVSGLGGNDLGIIQPPFSILPVDGGSGGSLSSAGVETHEFVIENIPFKVAIPMLTGWDLHYVTDDQNVAEIGIWIDEMHYEKTPNAQTGTLRYKISSILRDEDNSPGFFSSHKATILGLQAVPGITKKKSPDLVPFSPSGTDPIAFCRLEQNTLLRVTVRNQGNDNAPASKTTVTFVNKPFTLDTPPIPAGGSVDLLFSLPPAGCFSPDCLFKITVDSNNQVNETNEGNNNADGRCTG